MEFVVILKSTPRGSETEEETTTAAAAIEEDTTTRCSETEQETTTGAAAMEQETTTETEAIEPQPSTRGVSFGPVQILVFTNSPPRYNLIRPNPIKLTEQSSVQGRLIRQHTIPHPDNPDGVVNGRQVGPSASVRLKLTNGAEARRNERHARRNRHRNDSEITIQLPSLPSQTISFESTISEDTEGSDERPMKKARNN